MNVAVLSGGVGGARFVQGLVDVVEPGDVTVIGNVGDDVEVLGLHISPDLDSILYALAGLNDEERGWGRADETWRALETAGALGGETWFPLGDLDLGLHLVRTQALRAGEPLSAVTLRLPYARDRDAPPPRDRRPAADVDRHAGWRVPVPGVVRRARPPRRGRRRPLRRRRPHPRPESSGQSRRGLILVAPSNPYVSIGPILAVAAIREALAARRVPSVAVSPLIGGRAVKGPADRMLARLAGGTSPAHVAAQYAGLIDALVVDEADADDLDGLADVRPIVTRTLMTDSDARKRLAEAALGAVAA